MTDKDGEETKNSQQFDEDSIFDGVEEEMKSSTDDGSSDTTHNQNAPSWVPFALERLEDITNLIKTYQEEQRASKTRHYRHRETVVLIAAVTLLLLVSASAWMTVNDALSGDAFTFVLGTLFGALITFLQNMMSENTPSK